VLVVKRSALVGLAERDSDVASFGQTTPDQKHEPY
jgi:hypothetical protein